MGRSLLPGEPASADGGAKPLPDDGGSAAAHPAGIAGTTRRNVVIVAQDDAVYAALKDMVSEDDVIVRRCAGAAQFVDLIDLIGPGVLVLDRRPANEDGQGALSRPPLPDCRLRLATIVLVAKGDVRHAVRAMRAGAFDVVERPPEPAALRRMVAAGHASLDAAAAARAAGDQARTLIATLSVRERDVLVGLMEGGSNKEIARLLALSPRTIEIHRARLMAKLGVASLPEMFRVALDAGLVVRRSGSAGGDFL